MTQYNIDAINGCMQKALDYKPKFGGISDTFPEGGTASSVFGALPSSAGIASAVDVINSLMHGEFEAAENRMSGIAGALDAVATTVQNTEDAGKDTYRGPRYVQV